MWVERTQQGGQSAFVDSAIGIGWRGGIPFDQCPSLGEGANGVLQVVGAGLKQQESQ